MAFNIPEATLANVLVDELEKDGLGLNLETLEKVKEGDANTLFEIGELYHKKWNKYSKAMAWYQLAANKNDTKAKNNIGHMLHEGHGIPVDYRSAVKWFVQAAKDENESAISNVGECFELGHGLPVDKMKALEWYSKINTHSPDVTRISIEGYTLTNEQKEKPLNALIAEVEQLLEFEEAKAAAISDIENLQLAAPGKSYKIQIEIQANDEPTSHYQSALQAENRTLRDTCKQLNAMLKVLQRSNEYMMAQIDSKKLTSDKKMKQLEHENEEMKSKITNIERLLQGTDLSKCGSEETKPDSTDDDTTLQNVQCGKDNTDLCYDG